MSLSIHDLMTAYERDNPRSDSGGWIQWKGTQVCVDLHCVCGHDGHADADFMYRVRCPGCGRQFLVGQNIKLIELSSEEAEVAFHEPVSMDGETCGAILGDRACVLEPHWPEGVHVDADGKTFTNEELSGGATP